MPIAAYLTLNNLHPAWEAGVTHFTDMKSEGHRAAFFHHVLLPPISESFVPYELVSRTGWQKRLREQPVSTKPFQVATALRVLWVCPHVSLLGAPLLRWQRKTPRKVNEHAHGHPAQECRAHGDGPGRPGFAVHPTRCGQKGRQSVNTLRS